MRNKLVSLLTAPLVLTILAGCGSAPVIKEKPIENSIPIQKKNIISPRTTMASVQSDSSNFCDCYEMLEGVYIATKYIEQLKQIENYNAEKLQKNPENALEDIELLGTLMLKDMLIEHRRGMVDAFKNCGCYKRKL